MQVTVWVCFLYFNANESSFTIVMMHGRSPCRLTVRRSPVWVLPEPGGLSCSTYILLFTVHQQLSYKLPVRSSVFAGKILKLNVREWISSLTLVYSFIHLDKQCNVVTFLHEPAIDSVSTSPPTSWIDLPCPLSCSKNAQNDFRTGTRTRSVLACSPREFQLGPVYPIILMTCTGELETLNCP